MTVQKVSGLSLVLILYSCLFIITGIVTFGVGIWLFVERGSFAMFYRRYSFITASAVGIASGSVVIFVGFFGIIGALKQSLRLLRLFIIFLCLILLLEVSVAAISYYYKGELKQRMRDEFRWALDRYSDPQNTRVSRSVDETQRFWRCCGLDSHADWTFTPYFFKNGKFPDSCCKEKHRQTRCGMRYSYIYSYKGCFPLMMQSFVVYGRLLAGLGTCFAVFEVIGIVLTVLVLLRRNH